MTPTNLLNLPEPLVTYLDRDDYDRGEGSWRTATELIGPARAAALRHAFPEQEDVEDIADMIPLLMGKAIHGVLERAASSGIQEKRLYATIGGQRISGQFDHYVLADGLLSDWKSTSIFTVQHALKWQGVKRTRFEEWEQQLNVYAYLCELAGYPVTGLETVVILDGWSRAAARRSQDYPQTKVVRFAFRLWEPEEQQAFLAARVAAHLAAERQLQAAAQPDADFSLRLVHCTPDERWQEPSEWAVMRAGQARAAGVYPTAAQAHEAASASPTLSALERVQPSKRCLPGRDGYCPMRTACIARHDGQFRDGELALPSSWEDKG